jgi:hypothetical protein
LHRSRPLINPIADVNPTELIGPHRNLHKSRAWVFIITFTRPIPFRPSADDLRPKKIALFTMTRRSWITWVICDRNEKAPTQIWRAVPPECRWAAELKSSGFQKSEMICLKR